MKHILITTTYYSSNTTIVETVLVILSTITRRLESNPLESSVATPPNKLNPVI